MKRFYPEVGVRVANYMYIYTEFYKILEYVQC